MINIPEIERQRPEAIREFQFGKIRELLRYLHSRSPYYSKLFASRKIDIHSVTNWMAFEQLPTTTKDDLQRQNWDFFCTDKNKIVEFTSTSGTLGKPVTIGLTEKDVQRLAYNECISFQCADGTHDDLYQLMLTLDRQFMAGIAYYEGIRKLGAGLVRVGPGLPALQWETIDRLRPNALVAVPSFIVKMIEYAQANGIDLNTSSVKKIICIGESIRTPDLKLNTLGERILSNWNVRLYGTYAATEMQTAFTECHAGVGGHLHPELIYLEVLDEEGRNVIGEAPGEITITTLGVEGIPLLRYRTGDIANVFTEACSCGRTTFRVGPVLGRKQQMIKLKGTTLYPPAIFELLQQVYHVKDFVVEVTKNSLGTDDLKLYLLADAEDKDTVERELRAAFQSRLRVMPDFLFVDSGQIESLQAGGRKLKKFIDRR